MRSKKIMIYGEDWVGTLPNLLYHSLVRRGYQSKIFDFTNILPGIKNRSLYNRILRRLFGSFYVSKINRIFLKECRVWSPEIVIVSKGLHLNRSVLGTIRRSGAFLVNWNPDDFLNMKNSNFKLVESIPEYDMLVSPRENRFELYNNLGANRIQFIDWYYVPELHSCVQSEYEYEYEYEYEVSFVGSWSPYREQFIDQLNKSLHVWGGGWEKASSSFKRKHIVHNEILNQKEMSKVFAASKFNLNMLTHENSDVTNLRMFEVTASGGLLLTERNEYVTRYFKDREDVLMYSSSEEVNSIFSQNLDFGKIAANGMKRIVNCKNTFEDRVDILMHALEEEINAQ